MTGMDADHFGILNACIHEKAVVDDRALASMAILQERMTHLKQTHGLFADLSFSPQLEQLSSCPVVSRVG